MAQHLLSFEKWIFAISQNFSQRWNIFHLIYLTLCIIFQMEHCQSLNDSSIYTYILMFSSWFAAPCSIGTEKGKILYKGQSMDITELKPARVLHNEFVSFYCMDQVRKCNYTVPTPCIDGKLIIPECFEGKNIILSSTAVVTFENILFSLKRTCRRIGYPLPIRFINTKLGTFFWKMFSYSLHCYYFEFVYLCACQWIWEYSSESLNWKECFLV